MIAAMKRAFVVIREREKREALSDLRKLGLVHLEPITGIGSEYEELAAARASITRALGLLAEAKVEEAEGDMKRREGIELAERINRYDDEAKEAADAALTITKEMERIRPWGDFDPAIVRELASKGMAFRFVQVPEKKLDELFGGLEYIRLGTSKAYVRLAVLNAGDAQFPNECIEFTLPAQSLSELEDELHDARSKIKTARERIANEAVLRGRLKKALAKVERTLMFETARSGMESEGGLAWFSGWVPAESVTALSELAVKSAWALLLDDPLDEELPPTKVNHPAAVRMIQPVFDFLGTVPNYREYDISALFLIFFSIFVAMIFGDGGYGGVLLTMGIGLAVKAKLSGKKVPDPVRLLLILAGMTFAWGIVTMSWFGLPPEKIPPFLQRFSVYWLSNANPDASDNVKQLCFIIGLAQLSIAHLKNIKRDFPSLKFLGQLGQLFMLGGMYCFALNLIISDLKFPLPDWALHFVAVGFGLSFVFSNYEGGKNFFIAALKSILESLKNFVSVFLGVVNVFADIVSYIRLWAVGLAGLAISQTVNDMAGPLLGRAVFFVLGLALVVFGHGFNVIMGVLSVVVHGIRLNILEFSGHLGMEWSGYKYEPFKETVYTERNEAERSSK